MSKQILAAMALAGCGLSMAAYADTAVTENTTVGGKAFIDFTSLDKKGASGAKDAATGYGVDVPRFYLILNHTFDSMWSANLTTDFNYSSSTSETQLFVKKAYVQAKFSDAFALRAGSSDTTWIPFDEDVYGYRFVEKTLIDRLSFGNSADWGLHAAGKLADGSVGYAVSAVEGRGYKNPTRSKSLDWEGRVNFTPVTGLTAAVGFYTGKLGADLDTVTTVNTAQRFNALVAYKTDAFRVGAEYFTADNWSSVIVLGTSPKDKADGYSITGAFNLSPTSAIFARYDSDKPSKDVAPTKEDTYYNIGYSTKPRKGIDLAVAYKHDEVKTGSTSNSKYDEFGVWAQVAF